MNYVKTFVLMMALVLLSMGVGRLVGGPSGMAMGLLFAAVVNLGSYWFSDRMVLAMHAAREVTARQEPDYYRSVQKLALAGNLPMPKVYVIDDDSPNAFATGRNPRHAAVAATRGILDLLTAPELEAVMAHELSHVKHRDMLIGTIAAVMAGAIMMIGNMARWAALFGGFGGRDDERRGGGLEMLALAILAPLGALLIQMAISRSREYAADEGSAALTGDPAALARALRKIHAAAEGVPLQAATPAMAHLYIANPFGREGLMGLFMTHPSLDRRLARLERIQDGRIRPVF